MQIYADDELGKLIAAKRRKRHKKDGEQIFTEDHTAA
jgi:hypothetical protein